MYTSDKINQTNEKTTQKKIIVEARRATVPRLCHLQHGKHNTIQTNTTRNKYKLIRNKRKKNKAKQNKTKQIETSSTETAPHRTSPNRTEPNLTESNRTETRPKQKTIPTQKQIPMRLPLCSCRQASSLLSSRRVPKNREWNSKRFNPPFQGKKIVQDRAGHFLL